jgi:hypothetical protein
VDREVEELEFIAIFDYIGLQVPRYGYTRIVAFGRNPVKEIGGLEPHCLEGMRIGTSSL